MRRVSIALCLVAACGGDPVSATPGALAAPARAAAEALVVEPVEEAAPAPLAGSSLRVQHPRELDRYADLRGVERLDLALSALDRADLGAGAEADEDPCPALDLLALAERLPELRALRISGCDDAVHGGLHRLERLESLELVDQTLDGATMGRLLALPRLQELALTRVQLGGEPLALLRDLGVRRLALRDLAPDSELVGLIGLIPTLRELTLAGAWAGHKAMLAAARALRLEVLVLADTQIGNFSLNQIKGLTRLQRLELRGPTFNESSPLYLRDLPLTAFSCACPGLGDAGLRALRHIRGLRRIELLASRVTGAGIEALTELPRLESLTVLDRDLGPQGLAALARAGNLRELHLRAESLADPTLEHLGEITSLRSLTLRCPDFDDRAALQLRGLVHLEHLDLGGTQISDTGLAALAGLSELRSLVLHHTRVTNRGLAHVGALGRLEILELDHTDVVDGGVAHLAGLQRLRELRLDGTLVTDAALTTLAGLPALERLNLAGTVVTGDGVARLAGLTHLRSVNLEGTRARPP